ncbi:MAG TPA: hypothetical protein PK993_03945 [Clostridia bacterium]|nr:hypothetical protein [Clostridia bacterium]
MNKIKYKKAIKLGAKIEAEHKKTYLAMKRTKGRLSFKKFRQLTAKDHIKESGTKYYPELIKMEKKLKKKRYYARK